MAHRARRGRSVAVAVAACVLGGAAFAVGSAPALARHASLPLLGPPLTQAACPGNARVSVDAFVPLAVPLDDWAEELVFDRHGGMWVSRIEHNVLQRYDARGHVTQTLTVKGNGGLILGPDGLVYANSSGGPAGNSVVRFDPAAAHPVPSLFVGGLPGLNGSTFDTQGFFYESTEGATPSVARVRPDGTRDLAWERAAGFYGANGLTVVGGNLYGSVSFDQRSPIYVVPIANPSARHVFVQLSLGVLSRQPAIYTPDLRAPLIVKGLDDMTTGPDGQIYVVGFASGELLRVDPTTGATCVVASGFHTPTAVQFAVDFGGYDPLRDLFVTEAAGRIMHVHLG